MQDGYLHLWNGLPGDDGALVTDQTKCSTRCPTTPPWRGSCGWVHNKTNEMDKVFTLLGECSARLQYVRFPDIKEKTTQDLSILDALLISAAMYSEHVLPVQLF